MSVNSGSPYVGGDDKYDDRYRGSFYKNVNLGAESWFRCGGSADMVFEPADVEDLQSFLKNWPAGEPLHIIGKMANTIIRDGGLRGCVVRLGKSLSHVNVLGDKRQIEAGAGALNGTVASAAVKAGIAGLEFLSGVPGSIGGAAVMNAGAYGAEMRDVLLEVKTVDRAGELHTLSRNDLDMSYRHTNLPEGMIVVSVLLQGHEDDFSQVKERLKEIKKRRNETQPIKEKTGGSTFANPADDDLISAGLPKGTRAWELIDKVGGRGFQIGGAQMSEKHCNFMINTGNASAADLENLGEEMRKRVMEEFGLELHWEIKRIGQR